jgi:hypothetical protein
VALLITVAAIVIRMTTNFTQKDFILVSLASQPYQMRYFTSLAITAILIHKKSYLVFLIAQKPKFRALLCMLNEKLT